MNREMISKTRIAKKKVENILNRRNEFIVDNIFQGKIYISGTVELVEEISRGNKLNTQIAVFEESRIGLNFKNKEFHTLHFVEKDENLKNFIMRCDDSFEDSMFDKLVGIIIYDNKITDGFGVIAVGFTKEEFTRKNVRKTLENIFPSHEDIFNAMAKSSMIQSAKLLMLEELIYLQKKNKQDI
jgi:hypothetical protein